LKKHALISSGILFLLAGLVWATAITAVSTVYAQDVNPVKPPSGTVTQLYPGGISTLTGWITTVYGDPPPDSNQPGIPIVLLQADNGSEIARLEMSYVEAQHYIGQEVQVEGLVMPTISTQGTAAPLPILDVTLVRPVAATTADLSVAVSGSQPWVNLLCKFSDIATTPHPDSHYTSLFSTTEPGLNHYWQQLSYNQININGTQTVFQWFVLPQPRSFYVTADSVDLGAIFTDCTNAADASVNFPTFVGVNIMLNGSLGCCAWGGQRFATLDGQSKTYRVTWNPPNYQNHSTIAHEMGHGFGLPHSSGPANNPPSNLSVYVSSWDMMSDASGTCIVNNPTIGCLAPGTIGYYLEMLDWLPAARIQSVTAGNEATITLERLRLLQNVANKALIKIPIDNTGNRFYTVEVRDLSGYDQNVPGQAVIIHKVDLTISDGTNTGPALVVDADTDNTNVNDAGAMWQVGETFYDATNNI
jgi:M6 family metalloprotease-like protein